MSQTITDNFELWDILATVADRGESGLFALAGKTPIVCRIAKGNVVEVDGEIQPEIVEGVVASAGIAKLETIRRAAITAKIARTDLVAVIADLGVLAEGEQMQLDALKVEAMLRAAILSDGPWEWRPMACEGEGPSLLPALVRTLGFGADVKLLSAWSGPLQTLHFRQPKTPGWKSAPEQVRNLMSTVSPASELRTILAAGILPPREILAWLTLALRLKWLTVDDIETPPEPSIEPEPLEPIETADALDEITVLLDREFEASEEILFEATEEVLELDDSDVVELDAEIAEVVEEPEIVEEAEVQSEPEITPKKFHDGPVPDGVYDCLGLPEGAAGQGIAQAYSKRLRRIQKLLDERPGDRQIEAWKEALLRAYRIVNHSEALAQYDKLVQERGNAEGVAAHVVAEIGKKSLARGIQNLRRGNLFEGAKSIHESITWLPDSAEAWLALGFYQASLDEEDEADQALVSFGKALNLAPESAQIRYLHAVTAHFCGDRAGFENDREWLNQNAERAPSAWAAFLSHLKAA